MWHCFGLFWGLASPAKHAQNELQGQLTSILNFDSKIYLMMIMKWNDHTNLCILQLIQHFDALLHHRICLMWAVTGFLDTNQNFYLWFFKFFWQQITLFKQHYHTFLIIEVWNKVLKACWRWAKCQFSPFYHCSDVSQCRFQSVSQSVSHGACGFYVWS